MAQTVTLLENCFLQDTVHQYLLDQNFRRRVFKSQKQAIYWTIRVLSDADWMIRYRPKLEQLDIFDQNGEPCGNIRFINVEIDENDYGF